MYLHSYIETKPAKASNIVIVELAEDADTLAG